MHEVRAAYTNVSVVTAKVLYKLCQISPNKIAKTQFFGGKKVRAALYLLTRIQVLKDSGVFEYTWSELELWLDQLARVDPNQQETVIQFLERVSSST